MKQTDKKVGAVTDYFEGVLKRDQEFTDVYPDLSLLEQCPDCVFADLPFVSSVVLYKLWVEKTQTKIFSSRIDGGSATKVRVIRSAWSPLKFHKNIVLAINAEEKTTIAPIHINDKLEDLLNIYPTCWGLRIIANHPIIEPLCCARNKYTDAKFDVNDVMRLSDNAIKHAANLLQTEPIRLCFHAAHGLPGLGDMQAYDDINFSPQEMECISIYETVIKETTLGHSYTDLRGRSKRGGLQWLLDNGVLVRDPEFEYYFSLTEVRYQEDSIIEAIHKIEATAETRLENQIDLARIQLASGNTLCDEQIKAIEIILKKPILAIDGRAGSGKTDLISAICSIFDPNKTVCTAFQGVNAGQLSRSRCKTATTHHLLFEHATNHKFPDPKKSCSWANIEVMVIDEVGTQSLDLLSRILAVFAYCGKKKKLVLIGDLGQIPPIGGPAPFKSLLPYFEKKGYLTEFVHNHRTAGSIIITNANLIRDRQDAEEVRWNREEFIFAPPDRNESPTETLLNILTQLDIKEDDFIVVTHKREHARLLSIAIEKFYGGTGAWGICVGHKFCYKKNNYPLQIINNEILTLIAIEDRTIETPFNPQRGKRLVIKRGRASRVQSTTERKPRGTNRVLIVKNSEGIITENIYDVKLHGNPEKASAVTTNAMQGSARKTVIRVDFSNMCYSTNNRLYTDITRAVDRFIYIGEKKWFHESAKRPEPQKRSNLHRRIN